MKSRTFLSVLAFGFILSAIGQKATMELTFTAENNGQLIPLDSIYIENLTQSGDTTLYFPDTMLVLDWITSIGNIKIAEKNTFTVSQNYPNPFNGKTTIDLFLPEKDEIKIIIRDILGKELEQNTWLLNCGNHSFTLYSLSSRYYFLTFTGKKSSQTIKMLNINSHVSNRGDCNIAYVGPMANNNWFKSSEEKNGFIFNIGDELRFIAFTDVEAVEIIETPMESQVFTFQFEGWTPCPGIAALTDIEGNVYNTVYIGSQCWMKENLKTKTYNNGLPIQNLTDSSSWNNYYTPGYVWYNNDSLWKDLFGALYNYNAANDTNGLCPVGWHLPTHEEWTILTDFIGGTNAPFGNELKSCRQLNSPLGEYCNTDEHPRWEESSGDWGTDDYGFSALPGGFRDIYGGFNNFATDGLWWTATAAGYSAYHRGLYFNSGSIYVSTWAKRNGFSIRCIRDN